jgi:pyruvate dehydrogenase E2 component (dihydrolipoamide acetyltransferase)
MPTPFNMPSLGADMEAGTLVEWLKQPGDRVERGEAIAVVETQKGAIEIETYQPGTLREILVEIGQKVPVGQPLAMIDLDADKPEAVAPSAPEPAPARPSEAAPPSLTLPPEKPAVGLGRFSPASLRRAQELGLDLAAFRPGPDGIIGLREVEAAVGAPPETIREKPLAPPAERPSARGIDLDEMRKAIAAAMARSSREIPHYYVSSTLDVSIFMAWLANENASRELPLRLLYAAPLIKAVALALRAVPSLNGHYSEDGFQPAERVHLGIAIAIAMRGGGLVAPALLDADMRTPEQIMAALNDLVARVRGGRLRSAELAAGTATLTNLGEHSADTVQPIIYPPQVAIIGCGQIRERAWAEDDALSARPSLTVTVGGDHRVSDGRRAVQFLNRLDELLRQPRAL